VAQKGSLVAPDRLRFDFSHPKPLSAEELAIVEREVNHYLRQNDAVTVRIMAREEAIASGATALFGEKYGEEVRVVAMGREEDGRSYSVELCGGTHVARTGDIGLVRLTGESAVAAGIRRIEAVTGEAAFEQTAGEHRLLEELAELLRVGIPDLPARVASLLEDRRKLERELAETRRKLLTGAAAGPSDGIRLVGDLKLAARVVEGIPPKELRGTADALKKELGSGVVALVGVNEGKAAVVVSLTPDLVGRLDAVRLVRAGVEAVGGQGGGGRADFAQGGGPDAARAAEALAAIERALAQAHA
jgi:alanyl-tRNA synthetase